MKEIRKVGDIGKTFRPNLLIKHKNKQTNKLYTDCNTESPLITSRKREGIWLQTVSISVLLRKLFAVYSTQRFLLKNTGSENKKRQFANLNRNYMR